MWECIDSMQVQRLSYSGSLLLVLEDSVATYDLKGRKVLDQIGKSVDFLFGHYFVSEDTVYDGSDLSHLVQVLTVPGLVAIAECGGYWLISDSKNLFLYTHNGTLLDTVKLKTKRIIGGSYPYVIGNKVYKVVIAFNKIKLEVSEKKEIVCGNEDILITKENKTMTIYYKGKEALNLDSFDHYCIYKNTLFSYANKQISVYDCVHGVLIDTIEYEHDIKSLYYTRSRLIAIIENGLMFLPYVLKCSSADIYMLNIDTVQVKLAIGTASEQIDQELTLENCPLYKIPDIITAMSNTEILAFFTSLTNGLTNRSLCVIQAMNKLNHPVLNQQKETLLKWLKIQLDVEQQAARLKIAVKSLKTLPQVIPEYSVDKIYF